MALSLAACGGSSTTTTTSTDSTTTDTTTTTVDAAQALSLTIAADTVTGGSGADAISGARVDGIVTLNASDVIDGGAGDDTLTARTVDGLASSSISNVENLVFTETGTEGDSVVFSTASATYISGVTSITNLASTNAVTFARVTETADLTVNNSAAATTLQFADSVLSGASDSITVNLNAATAAVTVGTVNDADGDYESLTINATGAASDMVAGGGLGADSTTVTVNASVALDLGSTASFAKITSFDASGSTAAVTAVLADKAAAGTTAVSIKGGSAADVFDISGFSAANFGAVTVDMGAGNDTVTLGAAGASDFSIDGGAGTGDIISVTQALSATTHQGVKNFETLQTSASADLSLIAAANTISTVRVSDASAITNAAISNLELTAALASSGAEVDSVSVDRLVDGTADTLNVTTKNVTTDVVAVVGTFDVADEETLVIDSSSASLEAKATTATDLVTLTVSGDNNVALADVAGLAVATVDLTGMHAITSNEVSTDNANFSAVFASDAAMTVTGNSSTANIGTMTITTGSGNDNVTGTNNDDTITTGVGNDTIVGGGGADTMTGGAGVDTYTGGAGNDVFSIGDGVDVIKDFTKADGSTVKDAIDVTFAGSTSANMAVIEADATEATTFANAKAYVLQGDNVVDTSGVNSVDVTNIKAAYQMGMVANNANIAEGIAVFKADTDGDGTADAVQIWAITDAVEAGTDTFTQVATLEGYSLTGDLAGDFVAATFDIIT